MNTKELLKKHHSRLVTEGILRSALFGLAVGFGTNVLMGLIWWLFALGGIWVPLGVGLGVVPLAGVGAYFLLYRPNLEEVARRVDRFGLEERTITMLELRNEDSYIATIQRENAQTYLKRTEDRKLRIRMSRALVTAVIVTAILGTSMTTVVGLANNDVIPGGDDLLPEDPATLPIPVSYLVEEGGEIAGVADQLVRPGEDTTPVVAVPDDGWVFVGWDDGNESPERAEKNVTTELVFTAIFEEIFEGDGGDSEDNEGNGQAGSPEGDKADDLPGGGAADVENGEQGGQGDEGNGSGNKGENGGKGETEDEGEGGKGDGKGQGAGGKWEDSNQFLDGETYYRDKMEEYYQMALDFFEEVGEFPADMRAFFEAYFGSI